MRDILWQLALFSSKAVITVILILILFAGILALLSRGKTKSTGKILIKNLNKKYAQTKSYLSQELLSKKSFKQFLKQQKATDKELAAKTSTNKRVFVIHFNGDIKASAVTSLREEISAIILVATPQDEVVLCLESAGGMVHSYGLAAAQLLRLRTNNIPLTVCIDKVAASGGYLMAAVANKILAAPFAIIGSIGVVVQLPNFHRLLKEKNIDFEQLTAGNYKRTLSLFGENTRAGREKMQQEIEAVHHLFKQLIQTYRTQVDIQQVSTGEHWLGKQALDLKLVDALDTSDDYLLSLNTTRTLYEISFQAKKTLGEKLFGGLGAMGFKM